MITQVCSEQRPEEEAPKLTLSSNLDSQKHKRCIWNHLPIERQWLMSLFLPISLILVIWLQFPALSRRPSSISASFLELPFLCPPPPPAITPISPFSILAIPSCSSPLAPPPWSDFTFHMDASKTYTETLTKSYWSRRNGFKFCSQVGTSMDLFCR